MVVFAFVVILAMTLIEKRFARRRGHDREPATSRPRSAARSANFALDASFTAPAKRRDGDVRSLGLRQDHGGCAASPDCSACRGGICASTARSGRTDDASSCRPISGRSATCSRKRACFRICRCGAICCTARRAAARGADADGDRLRRGDRAARPRANCWTARRTISRAASASASRSAARCCRSRSCC